jgi:FKBP-type peptidyl-prolyl cis-trans isomerase FklB
MMPRTARPSAALTIVFTGVFTAVFTVVFTAVLAAWLVTARPASAAEPVATQPKATQSKAAQPKAASKDAQPKDAQPKDALSNDKQKASYIIGNNIGASMKRDGVDIDLSAFIQGLKDSIAGTPGRLSTEETKEVMSRFQKSILAKHEAGQKSVGDKNQKDGEAFLAKNSKEPGVTTTASGLQYKVVTEGTGRTAALADTVTAHYRGTLIDGTEFDSSYGRGEPAKFPVTGVIPGWTEVLQLMKIGSKVQVFIPSKLAYGERGAGKEIGPNATLIFEIDLLDAKQE